MSGKAGAGARLPVTALDGLFWFGIQRIAAEVRRLRKTGMAIVTAETEIFDTLTGTTRKVPVYRLAEVDDWLVTCSELNTLFRIYLCDAK